MGLDIFFAEDIRRALLAANESSSATAAVVARLPEQRTLDPEEGDDGLTVTLRAYLEGYRAALTTIALAFGLSPAIANVILLNGEGSDEKIS